MRITYPPAEGKIHCKALKTLTGLYESLTKPILTSVYPARPSDDVFVFVLLASCSTISAKAIHMWPRTWHPAVLRKISTDPRQSLTQQHLLQKPRILYKTSCYTWFHWAWQWPMVDTCKKVKVKFSRYRPGVAQRVGRGIALLFHDRGTRRGWVVSSTPRPHFNPGKDPVPILQEAGWAPGPVWTGGKSRPHRDSIPDRPARSLSL